MAFGGMAEAEWRMKKFGDQMTAQRRMMRERAKWKRYEEELAQEIAEKRGK